MIDLQAADVAEAFQGATGLVPLGIERVPRGYANVTFLIRTLGGRYLMKVTTRGPERVERAMRGSERARAGGVPTPRFVAKDVSGSIVPPFWIQEHLQGEDAERSWPSLTPGEREDIARSYGEVVACMHALPFHDDERALDVHTRDRFSAVLARLVELGEFGEAHVREVTDAIDRALPLLATVEPRLTHTDLHLENVLVSAERPARFVALLDFEQTHGSDPAEDFPKLLWWNFSRFPEVREPFYAGYGDELRHGDRFRDRIEVFCLYLTVAGIRYFLERQGMDDPLRPYIRTDNERQLRIFRERFVHWRSTGDACGPEAD